MREVDNRRVHALLISSSFFVVSVADVLFPLEFSPIGQLPVHRSGLAE